MHSSVATRFMALNAMSITPDQPSVRLVDAKIAVSQLVAPSVPEPDPAAQAWNVYQSAFRTLQGYQNGGLTATDLRNAQNQIQAELQAYATGLASQPANVQQAVRALHDIQRQINNALAAPRSAADQRFSSPVAYTEGLGFVRFGQEITQTYLGSQNGTPTWGLLLGDDPTPVFTSPRPITAADFRSGGLVQQALTRAGEARGLTVPSTGATQPVAPTAEVLPASVDFGRIPWARRLYLDRQADRYISAADTGDDNQILPVLDYNGIGGIVAHLAARDDLNDLEKAFVWSSVARKKGEASNWRIRFINANYVIELEGSNPIIHDKQFGGLRLWNTPSHSVVEFLDGYHGFGRPGESLAYLDRDEAIRRIQEHESGFQTNPGDVQASIRMVQAFRAYRTAGWGGKFDAFAEEWTVQMLSDPNKRTDISGRFNDLGGVK